LVSAAAVSSLRWIRHESACCLPALDEKTNSMTPKRSRRRCVPQLDSAVDQTVAPSRVRPSDRCV